MNNIATGDIGKYINTGQSAVFVIPWQILKKGQGHLQITDIPLVRCPQRYLDLGQMIRICLVKFRE